MVIHLLSGLKILIQFKQIANIAFLWLANSTKITAKASLIGIHLHMYVLYGNNPSSIFEKHKLLNY